MIERETRPASSLHTRYPLGELHLVQEPSILVAENNLMLKIAVITRPCFFTRRYNLPADRRGLKWG
jgi:hypothetical protein